MKLTIEQIKEIFSDSTFRYALTQLVKQEVRDEVNNLRYELIDISDEIKRKVNHVDYIQAELHKAGLVTKLDDVINKIKSL